MPRGFEADEQAGAGQVVEPTVLICSRWLEQPGERIATVSGPGVQVISRRIGRVIERCFDCGNQVTSHGVDDSPATSAVGCPPLTSHQPLSVGTGINSKMR